MYNTKCVWGVCFNYVNNTTVFKRFIKNHIKIQRFNKNNYYQLVYLL